MSTHIDAEGKAIMVDVAEKPFTTRTAKVEGTITVSRDVIAAIRENSVKKGDVLAVARIAAILAVKNTARVIPLCHEIPISGCTVEFDVQDTTVRVVCIVKCHYQTGVEMEALNGATTALLTIYDMCKSIDKGMEITGIKLLRKTGGKSGDYERSVE